jgi:hypothetical protein
MIEKTRYSKTSKSVLFLSLVLVLEAEVYLPATLAISSYFLKVEGARFR